MNLNTIYISGIALFAALSLEAKPRQELYAAFAMTKEQESSPLPTDSGVFLRASAEDDWRRIGPVIQSMNSIAVNPNDLDTIFIACGNGIVRSTDGGETWRLTTGWRESDVLTVTVDPENGENVYAASVWGVSLSRDGGSSWQPANKGLAETYSRTIIVDSLKPRRLLLGTADGVYESVNHGESWKAVRSSPKLAILRLARSQANHRLWIAGTEGKGVYLSRDDGKRWEPVANELKEANVYAVAADPADENLLAAGGWETGVWVSRDGGASWSRAAKDLPYSNITAMTFDENVPGRLWASTFEEGTYYSDDFGANWQNGNLDGAYVLDLGFVPMER